MIPILTGVNLRLDRGEAVAIVGPSGSGKSTLLNIIGTLEPPTSGEVLLDGKNVALLDEEATARIRNQEIGFIFQAHHLLPQCSVLENVLVPTIVQPEGEIRKTAPERAKMLLERVGLGQRLHHRPGQLSGGEQQRVAVVRALINQPKVLLADEPTGSLDRQSALELSELLVELNREQRLALIVVTHSIDLAKKVGRALELRDHQLREVSL